MSLDKQGRLAILSARRGPREHELFAAQIEVETKEAAVEHGSTGVTQEMVEEAKAVRDGIQAQIDVIDAKREEVSAEPDEEPEG
jgi:hypothetical protein